MIEHLKPNNTANRLTWAILLVLLIHLFALPLWVNDDAAMYLEMGEKILDGQRPYVDYEEVNFPLIHYLSALPALLGRWFSVPSTVPFMLLMWILVAGSAFYSAALIRRFWPNLHRWSYWLTTGVIGFSAYLYLSYIWGEREHIFALLVLLWFILRSARWDGQVPPKRLALVIGVVSGLAVGIKPHFIFIVGVPELIWWIRKRKLHLFTPEVYGALGFTLFYGLYFLLQPDLLAAFTMLLSRLNEGYGAYYNVPLYVIFSAKPILYIVLSISIGAVLVRTSSSRPFSAITDTFAYASLGGLITYLTQQKGWDYQRIPADFFVLLIVIAGIFIISETRWVQTRSQLRLIVLATVVIFATLFYAQSLQNIRVRYALSTPLIQYIETHSARRDAIILVDSSLFPGYPVLPAIGRRNASRYAVAHPIPLAYYRLEEDHTSEEHNVPIYAQEYLTNLQQDILQQRPSVVIVRRQECVACPDGLALDIYLEQQGFFTSEAMRLYRFWGGDEHFHVYIR
jgi:hypothetical protein